MPKAKSLIDNASYNADTVKALGAAFDACWSDVAHHYQGDTAIEGARIMLANCVLNIAAQGERDPIRLKAGALRTFLLTNP